jgi:hypothetical protein
MTSNEIRQIIGMKPSDDPNADELRNKNLSQSAADAEAGPTPTASDKVKEFIEKQRGENSK